MVTKPHAPRAEQRIGVSKLSLCTSSPGKHDAAAANAAAVVFASGDARDGISRRQTANWLGVVVGVAGGAAELPEFVAAKRVAGA